MPAPVPEYVWIVTMRDGSKLSVQAAYVQEGIGQGAQTVVTVPATSSLLVLKDASHKTVFAAPVDQVTCMERRTPATTSDGRPRPVPLPPGLTPGQIRALQESLNELADEGLWQNRVILLPPGSRVPQDPA